MVNKRKFVSLFALGLELSSLIACKHEAGVLDKCLGKEIKLDTSRLHNNSDSMLVSATTNTQYYIYFDSSTIGGSGKKPYLASIDNGKNWKTIADTFSNLNYGNYNILIKDADSCLSSLYPFTTIPQ